MAFAGAKNRKGDPGEPGKRGEPGKPGAPGKDGDNGRAATISIGIVETGSPAKVWNSGTKTDAILNFVLPRGAPGAPGLIIGEPSQPSGNASTLLGFYNTYSCGKLSNLDMDDFKSIDCCSLPDTKTRQSIDLGTIEDICL